MILDDAVDYRFVFVNECAKNYNRSTLFLTVRRTKTTSLESKITVNVE